MQEKTHYIAVTVIVEREGKYLICKRSENEKMFPGLWCVPGGKLEKSDFENLPKDTDMHWLNILELVARKEVFEETSLIIEDIDYVSSIAFLRPNGYSTVVMSMCATYKSGDVVLQDDELTDFAWVSIDELSNYEMIQNIPEQITRVHEQRNR